MTSTQARETNPKDSARATPERKSFVLKRTLPEGIRVRMKFQGFPPDLSPAALLQFASEYPASVPTAITDEDDGLTRVVRLEGAELVEAVRELVG